MGSFSKALFLALATSAISAAILPCHASAKGCERILLSDVARERSGESWKTIEANSEQRQPLYLGSKPLQLALGKTSGNEVPNIPERLRWLGQAQAERIREALGMRRVELEAWPVTTDDGRLTWAFARWRQDSSADWQWLDAGELGLPWKERDDGPAPVVPETLRPWKKRDAIRLFADIFDQPSLYDKPVFGDTVWTTADGSRVLDAWMPLSKIEEMRERAEREGGEKNLVARLVPQPARVGTKPATFVLKVGKGAVIWPQRIQWTDDGGAARFRTLNWPESFAADYREDLEVISGTKDAVFPLTKRHARFERKNNADPQNQLEALVDYLEERYAVLGVRTERQTFYWRGKPQSNLVAVIPGSLPRGENRPILLADHIDTAFSEKTYDETGKRVSAPGADDNVTAVATLLRAAEILRSSQPRHDIWLTHLTGEEFPGDDLGARKLVSHMLHGKIEVGGVVLIDMIGFRRRGDRIFQINPAEDPRSIAMALTAIGAADDVAPALQPVLRPRFGTRSNLFDTDGMIFAEAGYPVILFNEHINQTNFRKHPHYHERTDDPSHVDFGFATSVAKTAIETVHRLSHK